MKVQIVTTITTLIDLDTMTPDHAVAIDAEDAEGFPPSAIYAAVAGGCKAALKAVERKRTES